VLIFLSNCNVMAYCKSQL